MIDDVFTILRLEPEHPVRIAFKLYCFNKAKHNDLYFKDLLIDFDYEIVTHYNDESGVIYYPAPYDSPEEGRQVLLEIAEHPVHFIFRLRQVNPTLEVGGMGGANRILYLLHNIGEYKEFMAGFVAWYQKEYPL